MRLRLWRSSLQGRVARQRLIAGVLVLALVVGVLTTSTLFSHPAAASGQHSATVPLLAQDGTVQRLEVFETYQGFIIHKWSDDNGATWSAWASLPVPSGTTFIGTPAVVSDGPGRLEVFARNTGSTGLSGILVDTYSNGSWSGWQILPGDAGSVQFFLAGQTRPLTATTPRRTITILPNDPAVSSWGPGRLDLFQYWQIDGVTHLMHAWEDNHVWNTWEDLGASPAFQGNLAAASLGVGHIDVLGLGPNNELEDKWFANGSWHVGWDDLGTPSPTVTLTSSPSVTSPGSGFLDVFARGSDGGLWHLGFYTTSWGGWSIIDCCLAGDVTNSVAVVSSAASTLNVFAILTDEALYGRGYSYATNLWGPWQPVAPTANADVAAAVWTLPPPPPSPTATTPPPPPTPTRTPTPVPHRCLQPPCLSTP